MLSCFALMLVLAILAFWPSIPTGKISAGQDPRKSLDTFNREFIGACQRMDHPAAAALWADDGVDLLPGIAPMIGKAKISEWLNGLTPRLAGGKMAYCTVDWKDVQIQGDLAYEWGINRQKIEFPPPQQTIAGEGKILLILKRQADGSWKIALESWNSNPPSEQHP
jgi:ketosteroid isomerase-like protein